MKNYLNELSKLSKELTFSAKQEIVSLKDVLDKTISVGLEIGKNSKNAIVDNIDKSVELIKNASADGFELVKAVTETTKDIVSSATEQVVQYGERLGNSNVPDNAEQTKSETNANQISQAIEKLKGKDKVGVAGEALAAVGGAAGGAAAASTLASVAGASTLLGSTSLAGALGGVFVTATPVGWVVGAAAVAGAAGYGISKLVRSGSKHDQIREQLIKQLEARITKLYIDTNTVEDNQAPLLELGELLSIALEKNLITDARAESMVHLIEIGSMKAEIATLRIKSLITSNKLNLCI
jgi:hypothetical protein